MVEHVCVRHKAVSLDSIDLDAEDSTGDHHADLTVLLERELSVLRHFVHNQFVVCLDVFDLLANLVLERTSFQPRSLVLCVENWEVVKALWQNVNELVEMRVLLSSLFHYVSC